LFALSVAACYWLPWRDPSRWSPLLWILGPLLKGGGAILFIADHFLRHSLPPFCCSPDGRHAGGVDGRGLADPPPAEILTP